MPASRPPRPFFATWLRRTRKQLAPSGRLSELALILSQREGDTPTHWSQWLRQVLDEEITPSLDELTTLDLLLARPKHVAIPTSPSYPQACLF
ncbi:hypothetical protein HNR46_003548 [Haloferula luteola]|uniref:Uncharacterized protein n=1 Tax=Haloferula luteola TaxID=595692 RepID=A0A840V6K2_9BACT|nr:hypothetical protein [Haloferula luteola]MBB5353293.1 hypothetical protein [Haloferula luteola]